MSTNHTTHYDLCQWELTDPVVMSDFNADNAKLDAALHAKAEVSALEALAEAVRALPKMARGEYTGDGSTSQSVDFTDSLGRPPQFVLVRGKAGLTTSLLLIRGMTNAYGTNGSTGEPSNDLTITWSGNRVRWTSSYNPFFNVSGLTYCYFAIG